MNYKETAIRIRNAKSKAMSDEFVVQSAFEFLRDSGYAETTEDAMRLAELLQIYTSKVLSISGAYFTEAAIEIEHIEGLTQACEQMMSDELLAEIEEMLGEL